MTKTREVYVVDLRGEWERPNTTPTEVENYGRDARQWATDGVEDYDYRTGGYKQLVPAGNTLTFTHAREGKGRWSLGREYFRYHGTFRFQTEVQAYDKAQALRLAEKRLRRLMNHCFCRSPRITVW